MEDLQLVSITAHSKNAPSPLHFQTSGRWIWKLNINKCPKAASAVRKYIFKGDEGKSFLCFYNGCSTFLMSFCHLMQLTTGWVWRLAVKLCWVVPSSPRCLQWWWRGRGTAEVAAPCPIEGIAMWQAGRTAVRGSRGNIHLAETLHFVFTLCTSGMRQFTPVNLPTLKAIFSFSLLWLW